jgi:hypothetical protein
MNSTTIQRSEAITNLAITSAILAFLGWNAITCIRQLIRHKKAVTIGILVVFAAYV